MKTPTTTELWECYQELGSLHDVCKRYGLVSRGSLSERLRRAGHTLHTVGANKHTRALSVQEVRSLVRRTGSYAAAAQQIGSTPDAIRMRLARADRGAKA